MLDADYEAWTYTTWFFYTLAALYLVGFLVFWMWFETLERAAKVKGGDAVLRYNSALRGFPNSIYAKMFGKRAFEVAKAEPDRTQQGP